MTLAIAAYESNLNKILVTGQQQELIHISRIQGAKLTENKEGKTTYLLPATLDSCIALKEQKIQFTDDLKNFGNRLFRVQMYIERQKLADHVEPMHSVPIKAPYSLYQHQVRAYNIALALFGRGARKE